MSNGRTRHLPSLATRAALGCCVALVTSLVFAPAGSADPDGTGDRGDQPTIAEVTQRLDVLNHEAEIASEKLNAVRVEIEGAQQRLDTLQADVTRQRERVERLRSRVVGVAVDNFDNASTVSPTTALFTADDAGQLLDEMATRSMVEDQQAGLLLTLTQQQKQLGIQEQQAEAAVDALTDETREAAKHEAELDSKIDESAQLLGQLKQEERERILALQAAAERARQREVQAQAAAQRARQREVQAQRAAELELQTAPAPEPPVVPAPEPPVVPAPEPPVVPAPEPPVVPAPEPPVVPAPEPPVVPAPEPPVVPAPEPPVTPEPDPQPTRSRPRVSLADVPASDRAQIAVQTALDQVGDSYVYGAVGPDSFDCSGLTMYAWQSAGVSLPHASSAQPGEGTPVSISALQPGDLVFYYSPISHVGMYIGNGQLVHAANPSRPVEVVPVDSMPITSAVHIA